MFGKSDTGIVYTKISPGDCITFKQTSNYYVSHNEHTYKENNVAHMYMYLFSTGMNNICKLLNKWLEH